MEHVVAGDVALAVLRVAAGSFFALSGWNKLTNAGRHHGLVDTLRKDGIPFIGFMQWWVPGWELCAGASLALGFLSSFAAMVLAIICVVACLTDGKGRVADFQPINRADRVDDWLYLPETVYALVLVLFSALGSGPYSLDALL